MEHDSFDKLLVERVLDIDLVEVFYINGKRLVVNKLTPSSVIEEVRDRLLEVVSGLDIMLKQTDEMHLRPDVPV